jgi:geranyl-CoA carboxylase alpha subunit
MALRKLLIANRGEIACRIAFSARRLGIATVAVHTAADREARHLAMADEAWSLGADPRAYLDIDAVIEAALATGADAVHPGYGFLSESAELAEACSAAGLVWVGPGAEALRLLGDKAAAKALAWRLGLGCVPGAGPLMSEDRPALLAAADATGFPLLIKAAAGGGGRGMRVVPGVEELEPAAAMAASEAMAAFGSGDLLLERYIGGARHVEAQILCDGHGSRLFLGERDCSIQRRFQKIIEESPAPGLAEETRRRLAEAALRLAEAVDYRGAGTAEFLVDANGELYFLEVNPRLQVEHPLTEATTGLDLVAWQLRVAAGEALPFAQDAVRWQGHAIEARLYAEDPAADFLPQAGDLVALVLPPAAEFAAGADLRIDHGLCESGRIGAEYDPLIAKLIAHGPDRETARRRLRAALAATTVAGLTHNRDFLLTALDHPEFVEGRVTTAFVAQHFAGFAATPPEPLAWALAAVRGAELHAGPAAPGSSLWGFRSTGEPATWHERLGCGDASREIVVRHLHDRRYRVRIGQEEVELALDGNGEELWLTVGKRRRRAVCRPEGDGFWVDLGAGAARFAPLRRHRAAKAVDPYQVLAPMTSRVKSLHVAVGELVGEGQALLVLEAMKLEHRLEAAVAGRVAALEIAVGEAVDKGRLLLRLAPA